MTTDHALVQPNAQRAHRPPPICTRKPDPGAGQSSSAAVLLALQRAAGNRSVAGLVSTSGGRPVAEPPAMQRDPAPLAPSAPAAAAAPPSPSTPDDQQVIELYPIYDRTARKRVMVNSEHYEQERAALARYLRYLAKAIPEDAKQVLEEYPFEEVKEMYQEVTDALTNAGQRYARGELAAAGYWARESGQFTGIEIKAHKRFLEESALSYVGKRVGLAVIGFFEGAAEAMVGLVDTGAGLIGFHPDLEGKIAERYAAIKDAYSAGTGIDHNLTHDAEIGRLGGRVAESLATGKAIGQLGKVGMLINATQAAAGLKSTVEAVAAARANGASWSQILGDPVMLAQFAGALAGAAGAGGSAIPQLRQVLTTSGLVLSGAQIAALGTALATYQDDPALGEQGNFSKRADLLAAVLTSATFLANEVSAHAPQPGATGRSRPAERAPSAPPPEHAQPPEPTGTPAKEASAAQHGKPAGQPPEPLSPEQIAMALAFAKAVASARAPATEEQAKSSPEQPHAPGPEPPVAGGELAPDPAIAARLAALVPRPPSSTRRAAAELHVVGQEPVTYNERSGIRAADPVPTHGLTAPERFVLTPDEVRLPGQPDHETVPAGQPQRDQYLEQNALPPGAEHRYERSHDAEAKILERAAAALAADPGAVGELHLRTSHPPCPACTAAIFAFTGDHPNIRVYLH